MVQCVIKIVITSGDEDDTRVLLSTVVSKEELAKSQQSMKSAAASPGPAAQTMDAGASSAAAPSPAPARSNRPSLLELLASHPLAGVLSLPINSIPVGAQVQVELEFALEPDFNPVQNRYELTLPSGCASNQIVRSDSADVAANGGQFTQKQLTFLANAASVVSYSVQVCMARPNFGTVNAPLPNITSRSHAFKFVPASSSSASSSSMNDQPGLSPVHDAFMLQIGSVTSSLSETALQPNNPSAQVIFIPGLSLEYSLARTNTIEIVAIREARVPEVEQTTGTIKQPAVERGCWTVQITPPSFDAVRAAAVASSKSAKLKDVQLNVDDPGASSSSSPIPIARLVLVPTPRFFIYLLDCSASMIGLPWQSLVSGVESLLTNTLRPGDFFNVIAFDDRVYNWNVNPTPVNDTTRVQCADFLRRTNPRASAGASAMGTAINDAMLQVKKAQLNPDSPASLAVPYLYLTTDGTISGETQIAIGFECARIEHRAKWCVTYPVSQYPNRIYHPPKLLTLALGTFCNLYFLNHLSYISGGGVCTQYNGDMKNIGRVMIKQIELYGGGAGGILSLGGKSGAGSNGAADKKEALAPMNRNNIVNVCLRNITCEIKLEGLEQADKLELEAHRNENKLIEQQEEKQNDDTLESPGASSPIVPSSPTGSPSAWPASRGSVTSRPLRRKSIVELRALSSRCTKCQKCVP